MKILQTHKLQLLIIVILALLAMGASGCDGDNPDKKESEAVDRQQEQYANGQPIPFFDFSFERDIYTQIYMARNAAVFTWTVWRSDFGQITGSCPSRGYGLPYDVQITNPLKYIDLTGEDNVVLEQAEPNGLFSSKNTNATWVFCQVPGDETHYAAVYIEDRVTVYPWPVEVDYENNRVYPTGEKPSWTVRVNAGE